MNYQLSIMGMHANGHVFYILASYIGMLQLFPFLHIPALLSQETMVVLKYFWIFKTMLDDVLAENCCLMFHFNFMLKPTNYYFSVVIECRQLLCSYHLTLLVMMPPKKNLP